MTGNLRSGLAALAVSAGLLAPAATALAQPGAQSVTVYKTPWCGCCKEWAEAMEKAGYAVETHDMDDLSSVKKQAGIPQTLEACHTAVIGGDRSYVLEGHVPIDAIEKLMSEKPDIAGIATPGMPTGSLGMGFDAGARYTVYSFAGTKGAAPSPFFEAGTQ